MRELHVNSFMYPQSKRRVYASIMANQKRSPIDQVIVSARARGMTESEAAKFFGVTKQTFSNWKSRGLPPALHRRAAEFLGISIDEMLGRSDVTQFTKSESGAGVESDDLHETSETSDLVMAGLAREVLEVALALTTMQEPARSLILGLIKVQSAQQDGPKPKPKPSDPQQNDGQRHR
jgi:hypothetical protein